MRDKLNHIALLAVLTIGLTACGLAEAATPESTEPGTIAEGEPAPGTEPTPGRCLPEFPDCVDVIEPGDGPIEPITYLPIDVEGEQPGDATVIGGGEIVSSEGTTLTVGFWMGTDDCYAVERIDVAETDTKVAVDISVAPRALDQACILIAEARSVTVELSQPLGGRILEIGGAPVGN